jgi:hypothetical protein
MQKVLGLPVPPLQKLIFSDGNLARSLLAWLIPGDVLVTIPNHQSWVGANKCRISGSARQPEFAAAVKFTNHGMSKDIQRHALI